MDPARSRARYDFPARDPLGEHCCRSPVTSQSKPWLAGRLADRAKSIVVSRFRSSSTLEGQKSKARPWTEEELGRFLAEAFKDRFGALWLLAASCGARRSELAGVNRLGLNLSENPSVDFHDTRVLVNGRAEDSDGKTDAGWRTASLDSLTVEHLTAYLKKLAKERESFGPSYPTDGYLFVWEDGTRIHPGTITKTFNRIVDRAGVPRIRLHDIRHTYVTMARNHGVNRKLLAERIGHKNQTVTDTIYTHPTPGADRPIAETMGAVIQRAVEQAG